MSALIEKYTEASLVEYKLAQWKGFPPLQLCNFLNQSGINLN